MKTTRNKGYSLVEVLVAVAIIVIVVSGLFRLFIYCAGMAEITGNITFAISEAQDKIEEIRNASFDDIASTYGASPGNTFESSKISEDINLNGVLDTGEDINGNGSIDSYGRGVIYVTALNADLLQVDVAVCWRGPDGRLFGEDSDLDGVLDAGEDKNGNGQIDSTAGVSTYIARH